jgi:hypothetical protein
LKGSSVWQRHKDRRRRGLREGVSKLVFVHRKYIVAEFSEITCAAIS